MTAGNKRLSAEEIMALTEDYREYYKGIMMEDSRKVSQQIEAVKGTVIETG